MKKSMAKRIAEWSCQSQEDEVGEISIIQYGIEIIFENILKTIILVCIAIYFHQQKEVFVILLSFCGLRIHAGGIHAKTSLGCTTFMIAIEVGCILCNQFIEISDYVYILIVIISNILLWRYAPNGSESCELLSCAQKKKKRRYALYTANMLFCFGFLTGAEKLVYIPVLFESLTLLLFELRKEKR